MTDIAVVTGASGGIGGAIAQAMHGQGATVTVAGRNRAALDRLAAQLASRVHVVEADLGTPAGADSLARAAEAAMGRIDILINNAGITRDNLAVRMKDEDWQAVLEVDLTSAFRLVRAALRGMMRARWGRIVGITSVVGLTGNPGQANYAAAKAGMIGMTKSIAAEVASRGITVNCIAPGFVTSAMTAALAPEQVERLMARIPAGRFGLAEDVAAAAVYLASDESAYVTGHTLNVNGGMAMI
jgi:3-oxoacyl-[acyl-carrier protein] reductase